MERIYRAVVALPPEAGAQEHEPAEAPLDEGGAHEQGERDKSD
jgi:hypothetical protein